VKRAIDTKGAPAAIGPYSQGIYYEGKLLFTAGQIGLDPATGELVPGGIAAQTERACNNLKAVLEAGLSSFDKTLKTTIFLVDINDFPVVNEIYGRFIRKDDQPARSTVQVAALPKGALIEIECIASAA